jgi:predicted GIY-YIG superfamily endonuclease
MIYEDLEPYQKLALKIEIELKRRYPERKLKLWETFKKEGAER